MERTYAAFISYRHAPLDIAVAERLQKMLERYRVPEGIRQDGAGKLGLVFRDRDELPLTSDLTEDIYAALDNSQFLIVVCTPETPKSVWVAREIEYFISRHGYRRVLTVLAAGTPEESIPPQLTHIREEDGTVREVEPLCALVVAPDKRRVLRNLRNEFLRLVSAILACPYDALYQREKRHRMRRLAISLGIAGVVVLCFAGVMVRNYLEVRAINRQLQSRNEEIEALNQEIETQLHKTQINESQALAMVSAQQLAEGDQLGAIRSAISALPNENEDRPLVAEAESALFNALYAYEDMGIRFAARLEQDTEIYAAAISEDGSFAVTMDEGGFVRGFDVRNGTLLWSAHISYANYNNPLLMENNFINLSVLGDWSVLCVNANETIALSAKDGSVLYVIDYPQHINKNEVFFCEENPLLAVYDEEEAVIIFYDLTTGQKSGFTECPFWQLRDGRFRDDGTGTLFYAVFIPPGSPYDSSCYETYMMLTIDAVSFEVLDVYTCDDALESRAFASTDLLLSVSPNGEILIYWDRDIQYAQTSIFRRIRHLTRLSPQGEVLFTVRFEQEQSSSDAGSFGSGMRKNLYVTDNYIWYVDSFDVYSSYVSCYDLNNGSQLFETELSLGILWEFPALGEETVPGEELMALVLSDGTIRYMTNRYMTSAERTVDIDGDGIDNCGFKLSSAYGSSRKDINFCVIPEQDSNCAVFLTMLRDENGDDLATPLLTGVTTSRLFTEVTEQDEVILDHDFYIFPSGDRILACQSNIENYSGSYSPYRYAFTVYDAATLEVLDSFDFTIANSHSIKGFSADETKVFISNYSVSLEDHSVIPLKGTEELRQEILQDWDVASNPLNHGTEGTLCAYYEDGTLFWWQDGLPNRALCPYPLSDNYLEIRSLPKVGGSGMVVQGEYGRKTASNYPLMGYAIYSTKDDRWTWLDNPDTELRSSKYCVGQTHLWLATADWDGMLRIYDQDSDQIIHEFKLNIEPKTIDVMFFALEDHVLLFKLTSGRLLIVDTQTGDILCKRYIEGSDPYSTGLCIWFDPESEMLYVWDAGVSSFYIVTGLCIDTSDWTVRFSVPGLQCYIPASNRVLRRGDSCTELLHYPVYSTEELIQWGNKFLPHS